MNDLPDGQLLRLHRKGNTSAFTELVRRHESCLLQHARALLGGGRPYEDAVQEAFLKLAQVPPELPPEVAGDERLERDLLAAQRIVEADRRGGHEATVTRGRLAIRRLT